MCHFSPHTDHSNKRVSKISAIKISQVCLIHTLWAVWNITLGNSKRISRSNSTNKMARNRKGELKA